MGQLAIVAVDRYMKERILSIALVVQILSLNRLLHQLLPWGAHRNVPPQSVPVGV